MRRALVVPQLCQKCVVNFVVLFLKPFYLYGALTQIKELHAWAG